MTDTQPPRSCRGRFAPSPTGPLHFGSLLAAIGSYCQARYQNGQWLVRMEDVDTPRCQPGADTAILRTLERFALYWDEEVIYQSRRTTAYEQALDQLQRMGMAYACSCSRKQIAERAQTGVNGHIYPGWCRTAHHRPSARLSRRVLSRAGIIRFSDQLQGPVQCDLEQEVGDFIVYRADGLFAYQLAVVVDDAWQGITQVVRGSDLLMNTPMQIHLQNLLGLPRPEYLHLPVLVDDLGRKLSKQNLAPPVDDEPPVPLLLLALELLGQNPDPALCDADVEEIVDQACRQWQPQHLPPVLKLPMPAQSSGL